MLVCVCLNLAFRLSTNDCVSVAFLGGLRGLAKFRSCVLYGTRPWKTSVFGGKSCCVPWRQDLRIGPTVGGLRKPLFSEFVLNVDVTFRSSQ